MNTLFSKLFGAVLISCIVSSIIFGVICLDKFDNNLPPHTESVLTACVNDLHTCTATHEFLGNIAIVSSLLFLALLIIFATRYSFTLVNNLFKKKRDTSNLNVSQLQIIFVQSNYLVKALSSGILNPRFYG